MTPPKTWIYTEIVDEFAHAMSEAFDLPLDLEQLEEDLLEVDWDGEPGGMVVRPRLPTENELGSRIRKQRLSTFRSTRTVQARSFVRLSTTPRATAIRCWGYHREISKSTTKTGRRKNHSDLRLPTMSGCAKAEMDMNSTTIARTL